MRDCSKNAAWERRRSKVRNPIKQAPIVKIGLDEEGNARYMRGESIYHPQQAEHKQTSKYNGKGELYAP